MRIDRLLVHTIEASGIVIMVGAVYLVVVLGFGDAPDQSERRVLGLSIVAAVIAALLYGPVKSRLSDAANRRVYGERQAPDEPLQTFGARMSRAIPLEELLLQLAESLKKSMQLTASEVWTGTDGVLELAASVPFREPPRIRLNDDEVTVIARAHVSGNAWLQVWLPTLARRARRPDGAGRAARALRRVARAHRLRRAAPATRRSPRNRIGCSRSSPVRSPSRSTTRGSTPRCRPRSTICASPTTSCACRAPASSPRPTSPAVRSSATSTTARSSTSSRWR